MTAPPRTVLIVGLGAIGSRHARIVRQLLPDAKIIALRRQNVANASNVDRCVTTLDDALECQPQVAVISSPASHHLDVAAPLARAGVHLLVEKPISTSTEGVSELIDLCRAREVTLMPGYNLRFMPSLQRFRDVLQEKTIVGRVLSVRAEVGQYLPSWRPGSDYRRGVSARSELGGGVLLELSHELDYLRWLFGDVKWVSAVLLRQSDLDIDVEDTAHLTLGFDAPATAGSLVASLNMDFVRRDSTRTCTVIGDSGTLRWDAIRGSVDAFEEGRAEWRTVSSHTLQPDISYVEEWRHFLHCVASEVTPAVTGQDGLEVLKVIAAARRSSLSGAVAFVGEVDATRSAT